LVLAQYAQIVAVEGRCIDAAVQLIVVSCMGRKIQVEETASHNFWFLPRNSCAAIKVAPMARAMPAIP